MYLGLHVSSLMVQMKVLSITLQSALLEMMHSLLLSLARPL